MKGRVGLLACACVLAGLSLAAAADEESPWKFQAGVFGLSGAKFNFEGGSYSPAAIQGLIPRARKAGSQMDRRYDDGWIKPSGFEDRVRRLVNGEDLVLTDISGQKQIVIKVNYQGEDLELANRVIDTAFDLGTENFSYRKPSQLGSTPISGIHPLLSEINYDLPLLSYHLARARVTSTPLLDVPLSGEEDANVAPGVELMVSRELWKGDKSSLEICLGLQSVFGPEASLNKQTCQTRVQEYTRTDQFVALDVGMAFDLMERYGEDGISRAEVQTIINALVSQVDANPELNGSIPPGMFSILVGVPESFIRHAIDVINGWVEADDVTREQATALLDELRAVAGQPFRTAFKKGDAYTFENKVDLDCDANVFAPWLGPRLRWAPAERVQLGLTPAVALMGVTLDADRKETLYKVSNGTRTDVQTWKDSESDTSWLFAAMLRADATVQITDRFSAGLFGAYQWVSGNADVDVGPNKVSLDLDSYEYGAFVSFAL